MGKTVTKRVAKRAVITAITPKKVDEELVEHLKQAEHHLIAAINLFSGQKKPLRGGRYLKRLIWAQETITGLYREELVRIRGIQRR